MPCRIVTTIISWHLTASRAMLLPEVRSRTGWKYKCTKRLTDSRDFCTQKAKLLRLCVASRKIQDVVIIIAACLQNNITSPPDCVAGATPQIKKNLLLPPMQNGLAVEHLCSVPDWHFDPLQTGREPALSASLSPHARPWAGPTSLHPIAQSGRVLTPRNEDLEVEGCRCAIRLTRVRRS